MYLLQCVKRTRLRASNKEHGVLRVRMPLVANALRVRMLSVEGGRLIAQVACVRMRRGQDTAAVTVGDWRQCGK